MRGKNAEFGTNLPASFGLEVAIRVQQWDSEGMLAIRLDPDIEDRLDSLAKKTGRTKTFYAREAILRHLEDLEDIYLATKRLKQPAQSYSAEQVKRELGLSD